MLDQLDSLLQILHTLVTDPNLWKTVDVTYEDPHVERVWTQVGENRLSLHRIHPCDKPLFHPHPWPSAMVVADGTYTMGIGRSLDGSVPVEVARLQLAKGSRYEMVDPYAWHWVQPVGKPVMTIMVTGQPWRMPFGFPTHGKGHVHQPLKDEIRDEILEWFRTA